MENRRICRVGDVKGIIGALQQRLHYRIRQYGDHGFASVHEILGLITEEYLELCEAVHTDKSDDREKIYNELMDIMVGCLWGLLSISQKTIDW